MIETNLNTAETARTYSAHVHVSIARQTFLQESEFQTLFLEIYGVNAARYSSGVLTLVKNRSASGKCANSTKLTWRVKTRE